LKLVIDNISDASGWIAGGGAAIGVNELDYYIAGDNNASVTFKSTGINQYVEKEYNVDVSKYDQLVLSIYSIRYGQTVYRKGSDFEYKISLGSTEYYLPLHNAFTAVTFDISDVDTITTLRITSLKDDGDVLALSYMVASKDDLPLDIFSGIKEQFDNLINKDYNKRFYIGKFSGSSGDNSITYSGSVPYLSRYLSFTIDDGVNTETHHARDYSSNSITFTDLFDGDQLLNDYTDADTYINIPVQYTSNEQHIVLPSINIESLYVEPIPLTSDRERTIIDFLTNDTFFEEQAKRREKFHITIDCEAREISVLETLTEICRKIFRRQKIWVNGRRFTIEWDSNSTEIKPTETIKVIPKVQFEIMVAIKEDVWNKVTLPKTTTINVDVNIDNEV
jgi:hypothetical protein